MNQPESIVYGLIQDFPVGPLDEIKARHEINEQAIGGLLPYEYGPLLYKEMFATTCAYREQAMMIHFATVYHGIEYEWSSWLKEFENLLHNMYWCSATVHLHTELKGHHQFSWESTQLYHQPHSGFMAMRSEWLMEGAH